MVLKTYAYINLAIHIIPYYFYATTYVHVYCKATIFYIVYLFVYLVQLWPVQRGPKVASFNIGKGCRYYVCMYLCT